MGFYGSMATYKTRTSSTIMKFKNWLKKIEEAKVGTPSTRPPKPAGSFAKPDMTSYRGVPYGASITQVPFAKTWDNPAVIAIPAGVGTGVDDEMKKMGREFSPTPRLSEFPTEKEPNLKYGSLPLQRPTFLERDEDGKFMKINLFGAGDSFKGINFQNVSRVLNNPEYREKLRDIDSNPDDPNDPRKFLLANQNLDFNQIEAARLFTRFSILTLIVENVLDTDPDFKNKYEVFKPNLEYENLNEEKNILTCVFSFKPKNENIPDNLRGIE